jgi:hypothetical protein
LPRFSIASRLKPSEDEKRETEQEGRDPVLDVVVTGTSLVTRDEGGERAGRLDPIDDREDDEGDPENRRCGDHRWMTGIH